MNQGVPLARAYTSAFEATSSLSAGAKIALFVSALLVLCNYYYTYFTGAGPQEGANEGGGAFRYLKMLALLVFYVSMLAPKLKVVLQFAEVLLLTFFGATLIYFFSTWENWDSGGLLYLNMVACALPFLLFPIAGGDQKVRFFLDASVAILVVQIAVDALIHLAGFSLWDNKAFVGGLGNPSSFGVVCNIFVAYILFCRGAAFRWLFALCVLGVGIVMTSSMLSVFLLGILLAVWGWFKGAHYLVLCLAFIVAVALIGGDKLISDSLLYKLSSLTDLFGGGLSNSSVSVYYRAEIHRFFVDQLDDHFVDILLKGYPDTYYYFVDSQFVTLIASFGLFISAMFFVAIGSTVLTAYRRRDGYGRFCAIVILMFMVVFFSNRILDYYPVPLFLFLLMASVRPAETSIPVVATPLR